MQIASASKETMAAALGSSPPAPADATTAVAAIAAASVQADPEDQVDGAIASALEGINLALSMDNLLGFSVMSSVSRESEIQGEPPQVTSLSSPLSQGEQPSTISVVASSVNISSYMDMLFGSKTPKYSDPPK